MAMESPGFANQASTYSAEVTRRAVFSAYARTAANTPGIISGGLLSTSDLQIAAPGSGLSVNVGVGEAIVGGSEGGVQGGYYTRNASTTNLSIAAANPSNPRVDTIALTIADTGYTEPTGVSGNAAVLQVLTGTPTASASLANLLGVAALPLSSLLLGYCLVPTSAANIITADISNVASIALPFISRQYGRVLRTANASAGTDYAITTTTADTPIDATNLTLTLKCSGRPLRLILSGNQQQNGANNNIAFNIDGVNVLGAGTQIGALWLSTGNQPNSYCVRCDITPSAGTHTFVPTAWTSSGTFTLLARAVFPIQFTVEEIV